MTGMTKEEFERQWNLKYSKEHLLTLRIGIDDPHIDLFVTGYSFSQNHERILVYHKSEYIGCLPLSLIREVV